MALILQHLTVKSFWADHWPAVRSSDDNIRDDGEDLVNHGRRLVVWFRKINRVNAIIAKFLTILKLQPNRATLRSDLTQAVR